MRGRKPKPVELRVLHGTAADKARASQPHPRRALPRCPEHLEGEAAKCWKRLSRELYDAGLLAAIDRDALASYCQAYGRYLKAENMLSRSGEVILTNVKTFKDTEGNTNTEGGNLVQNPWLAVSNRALEQMTKLAAEFGMTPSSRSRVKAEISTARAQARPQRQAQPSKVDDAGDDPRRVLEGTA